MRDVPLMEIIEGSDNLASHLLPDKFWKGIPRINVPGEKVSVGGELHNDVQVLVRLILVEVFYDV